MDANNQVDDSLDTQLAEYDNQSYDQESDQEGIKKIDQKREIIDSSKSNSKNTNDISDDDIKYALSKLSPNELMVLDKIVNNNNFESNLNDDQELIRESRSNKKRKDKERKRKNDDDEDDDNDNDDDNNKKDDKQSSDENDNDDESELDNIFNQQECFGANCKGGCVIKRIKIRGKRDSNGTTTSSTDSPQPPPPSSNVTSQLVDQTVGEVTKKSKRQSMPNYFKRSSYNPNLDKRIQGKITYLREKGKRDSKNRFDKAYRMKHNIGYNQYIRRKRENAKMAADNPKSPEHIKLLEESFPNSNGVDKSFQSNEPLVRVKRDD